MQSNILSRRPSHGMAILAGLSLFLVLVLPLGHPLTAPAAQSMPTGAGLAAPGAAAGFMPALRQFTAGGHVVGFAPTQVVLAAFDHALRVEFVGTAGVAPVATAADAASFSDGLTLGRARPLSTVTYPDLWPGVSVEYRASAGGIVKSTYTVAPGADAGQIRLRYNAPVEMQGDGSLRIAFGRGHISESAPLAWQEIAGQRVPIAVAFVLVAEAGADASPVTRHTSLVTFRVGAYDARYPLTIDPNYIWHTFYGSAGWDAGYGIAVDGSGNVYITGSSGAWQGDGGANPLHAHSGGSDIVVVKLNSAGAYQWHTFYGSSEWDHGTGIAIDGSGDVYIAGGSNAAWQGDSGANPRHAYSGGCDIVVVKLTGAGAYQWHSFYGSSATHIAFSIAATGSNNVYITGYSYAAWQGDGGADPLHPHSGGSDIVVLKLTGAGAYQWHTFYGSSLDDTGYGIAVDGSDNVYIAGSSQAAWQGDGGANPLHPHSGGTNEEANIVVVKLTSTGAYRWHTFYGSSSGDSGRSIAVDGGGNVYITGYSRGAWQGDGGADPRHPHSGYYEIVALKLNSAGAYQWHTFYGSPDYDEGYGIAVDGSSNVYITGYSNDAWQGDGGADPLHAYSGGSDIVALKLTGAGAYQWHTFYGSSAGGYGIAVDGSGSVYITGESYAAWQGDGDANPRHAYSGDADIVALKLSSSPTAVTLNFFTAQVAGGEVVLEWQTAAEVDVVGFDVYRAAGAAGPYSRITSLLIPAQGDALSGASYRYVDAPGYGTFSYQLEAVHADGSSMRHGPVGVQVVPPRIFLPSLLRGR